MLAAIPFVVQSKGPVVLVAKQCVSNNNTLGGKIDVLVRTEAVNLVSGAVAGCDTDAVAHGLDSARTGKKGVVAGSLDEGELICGHCGCLCLHFWVGI